MVAEKEDCEDESLRLGCPVLVTERLVMRRPHLDDVPELAALANNRRIADMLSRMPHPYGEAEARAVVAAASPASHLGDVYALTIAESGAFIGAPRRIGIDEGMTPRYIAARRPDGSPSRHITRRRLERMRRRFRQALVIAASCLVTAACVLR